MVTVVVGIVTRVRIRALFPQSSRLASYPGHWSTSVVKTMYLRSLDWN